MQTIVLYFCYIVLILLFSTAYNTSLIYCFVIWCLHTNKRRPCSSTLSGHPSSSFFSTYPYSFHGQHWLKVVASFSAPWIPDEVCDIKTAATVFHGLDGSNWKTRAFWKWRYPSVFRAMKNQRYRLVKHGWNFQHLVSWFSHLAPFIGDFPSMLDPMAISNTRISNCLFFFCMGTNP